MKIYKNISLALLVINLVIAIIFGFCVNYDADFLSFDFVAFDFTVKQSLLSRLSLSIKELLNSHILNSLQYNTLPCCIIINTLVFIIAFIFNIGRWQNLICYFVQVVVMTFLVQLSYSITLNSSMNLMLFFISGVFLGVCALLYGLTLLSFLYVKMINPIRRGVIIIFVGILFRYKNYLYEVESSSLFGQMFNVIIIISLLEIVIDFWNVVEMIVQYDKNNKRVRSSRFCTEEN